MKLENDHNVYILGAGFSREAHLPLISDFLVQMRDSHEWLVSKGRQQEAQAAQSVLQFRLQAAAAAYYVSMDLENIEELFSLAAATEGDMDNSIRIAIAATIDFVRHTNPLQQLEMLIANSTGEFSLFTPPAANNVPAKYPIWAKPIGDIHHPSAHDRVGPFRITAYALHIARLLGLFQNETPRGQNTFITFNYDTVLEEALAELGIPFGYGFAPTDAGTADKDSGSQAKVPVLKMHGSVNSPPFQSVPGCRHS
jgi:hypothetical protein